VPHTPSGRYEHDLGPPGLATTHTHATHSTHTHNKLKYFQTAASGAILTFLKTPR
jgi:hypothetical protein